MLKNRIPIHLVMLTMVASGFSVLVLVHGGRRAEAQSTGTQIAPGLMMPAMDPVRGKQLFAGKGCVVCHQVNGVGGTDAPKLDASTMAPMMNPFDFFAKMWHGAPGMIAMQQGELGAQVQFTGQDLADIVAFVHNKAVQSTFSEDDIPDAIKAKMEGDEGEPGSGMMQNMMDGTMNNMPGMGNN